MKNPGQRKFPVLMHMPAEEDSIHESDQNDDEKENAHCIEIGLEFLCGKEGIPDNIDFQDEGDD